MNEDRCSVAEQALRYWLESGAAASWVEARGGRWDHADWLELLEYLRRAGLGGVDQQAMGRGLERLRQRYLALRAFEASGLARRWVEQRRGGWNHDDWLALLDEARRSFGPVEPGAVGRVLEEQKRRWWNLQSWVASGAPRLWVEARQGQWGHDDWLALLRALKQTSFWPLEPDAVGAALEELKASYANLRRWLAAGGARRWVARRCGRWVNADWLALLDELRRGGFGPVDHEWLGRALDEARAAYWRLGLWQQSGEPRRWVERRRGRWGRDEVEALLAQLRNSRLGPLEPAGVVELLEEERDRYYQRWRAWSEVCDEAAALLGERDRAEWLALAGRVRQARAGGPAAPARHPRRAASSLPRPHRELLAIRREPPAGAGPPAAVA